MSLREFPVDAHRRAADHQGVVAYSTTGTDRTDPARPWLVTALIWIGGLGFALAVVTDIVIADATTAGSLTWIMLGILPVYLVAVWLARRRPDHPQTRRLLLLGAVFAVGVLIENAVAYWYSGSASNGWLFWANLAGAVVGMLGTSLSLLLFATYPDGEVERAWQRVVVRALWALPVLPLLWVLTNAAVPLDSYLAISAPTAPATLPSPLFVPALAALGPVSLMMNDPILLGIGVIGVLFFRFITAPPEQRRRMRLLVYTLVAGLPLLVALAALRAAGVPDDAVAIKVLSAFFLPFMLAIPVSIVVGVLRYRLYDIDVIVRRSVVYGALTFGIALLYVALAAAPGLALGDQIPVQLAVIVTIAAAIAFQPLRHRLERLAP